MKLKDKKIDWDYVCVVLVLIAMWSYVVFLQIIFYIS